MLTIMERKVKIEGLEERIERILVPTLKEKRMRGGVLKIVNQSVLPALQNLGYTVETCERIIGHIDRYDTIEDVRDEQSGEIVASGLKPEHLAIFDCAFSPSRGSRSLGAGAHLGMMGAAQPLLSGAISKTVNMPQTATVEEIMATYVEAWRLGL